MKTILVPTDFSANALRAFQYAYELFGSDANYLVLNTYCEPRSTTASMVSLREILHESSIDGLKEFMAELEKLPIDMDKVSSLSEYGDSIETICSTARIKNADMIIMRPHWANIIKADGTRKARLC